MTEQELKEFKEKSRENYKKVNQHMKDKCEKCGRDSTYCKDCGFDFSKLLMRSILVTDDCVCRKCAEWLTNLCYNQGGIKTECMKYRPKIKED